MINQPELHDDRNANDLLTIDEAADILRTPKATLRYWRHLGTGPHSFRLGRRVVYRPATSKSGSTPSTTPTDRPLRDQRGRDDA